MDFSPTITDNPNYQPHPQTNVPVIKFILIGILSIVVVVFLAWNIQVLISGNQETKNNGPLATVTPTPDKAPNQDKASTTITITEPKELISVINSATFNLQGSAPSANVLAITNDLVAISPIPNDYILIPAKVADAQDQTFNGKFGAGSLALKPGVNFFTLTSFGNNGRLDTKQLQILNINQKNFKDDLSKLSFETGTYKKVDTSKFNMSIPLISVSKTTPEQTKPVTVDKNTKYFSTMAGRSLTSLANLKDGDAIAVVSADNNTAAAMVILISKPVLAAKTVTQGKVAVIESNESGDQLLIEDGSNTRVTVTKSTLIRKVTDNQLKTLTYSDLKNGQMLTIIGQTEKNTLTASQIFVNP